MEKGFDKKTGGQASHKVFTIIGIILCIILLPILVINITLIIKGTLDDTMPPSIFGTTPLVVLSGSMDNGSDDAIQIGDLIFVKDVDRNNLKVNDVVAFMEGKYAVTHRIIKVNTAVDGSVTYITQGDANNTEDADPLIPENIIGKYSTKLSGAGNFVLFLQTTPGMLLFVGLPLILFIAYDVIRRSAMLKKEKLKQEQLKEELEKLKTDPGAVVAPKEVLKEPTPERNPWEYPKDALKAEPLEREIRIPAPMPQDYAPEPAPAPIPAPAPQPSAPTIAEPVAPAPVVFEPAPPVPQSPAPQPKVEKPVKQPVVVKAKKKPVVIKVKTASKK